MYICFVKKYALLVDVKLTISLTTPVFKPANFLLFMRNNKMITVDPLAVCNCLDILYDLLWGVLTLTLTIDLFILCFSVSVGVGTLQMILNFFFSLRYFSGCFTSRFLLVFSLSLAWRSMLRFFLYRISIWPNFAGTRNSKTYSKVALSF